MRNRICQIYKDLSKKYGKPKDNWEKWCRVKKSRQDREEIALGAILTQRVSWLNVEQALENLKSRKALSIEGVYQLGRRNLAMLEQLIKPTGFYRQKAKRILDFCEFIIKNYGGLENFFQQDWQVCRDKLLSISGIGPETADSILLYAGDKPVFIIDEYTRRFAQRHNLSSNVSYSRLQELFQKALPCDIKIYRDFHAMIVLQGRGTNWDLRSKLD